MHIQVNARYHFNNSFQGEHAFELFNDSYLGVRSRQHPQPVSFKLEVATLNPKVRKVRHPAWIWLLSTVAFIAAGLYSLYTLQQPTIVLPVDHNVALGGVGVLFLLAIFCGVVFLRKSEKLWVFETRAAHYPLISIPYNRGKRREAAQFVQRLQQAIATTNSKKGYDSEALFAGEMRMLRRLTKAGVLNDKTYHKAKKNMLGGAHGQGMMMADSAAG